MKFDVVGDMNWLAAIVGGIAYFALGAVWFMPATFGKAWQRAMGWEMPSDQRPGAAFYVGPFITCLVAANPMTWFAVTAGYHLVGLLIVSVIVSLWT